MFGLELSLERKQNFSTKKIEKTLIRNLNNAYYAYVDNDIRYREGKEPKESRDYYEKEYNESKRALSNFKNQ